MPIKLDKLNQIREIIKDEETFKKLTGILNQEFEENFLAGFSGLFDDKFFYSLTDLQQKKTEYSTTVKNITGYSLEEIDSFPGKLLSLVHDEDLKKVKDFLNSMERESGEGTQTLVFRIFTKQEKEIWLEQVSRVLEKADSSGKKIISVFQDITGIKASEDSLKEKVARLEEKNSSKDTFISIVSHDLKSPFTSLLGFSEILLNEKDLNQEEKEEYLNYIYEASEVQLNYINNLLEWSRLQTGRVEFVLKRTHLSKVVHHCIAQLTHKTVEKGINIKVDIPEDFCIQADERLICRAFTNLIDNAVKFSPEKSVINVTANEFKKGLIEVTFRDEGTGIDEKDFDKLFRIDKKFAMEGTGGEKGSELGLTIVKEIMERHNGNIWFYSTKNEGSEFHLTIPEAKKSVILVEDEKNIRNIYKKMVSKILSDYEIIEAENGYEAINIINKKIPSLIITDHDMPLMNGIKFVEGLRKLDVNLSIPVVVVSAKFDEEIINCYKELGVFNLIGKPFDRKKLEQCLLETAED